RAGPRPAHRRGPTPGGGRDRPVPLRDGPRPRRGDRCPPSDSPAVRPGRPRPDHSRRSPPLSEFLWVIVPYLCLATFVIGHVWRWRYDQFGWTTRSSQLYESKLLRIGSPLFHFGMLGVLAGHIIGLVIPKLWTDALGIS